MKNVVSSIIFGLSLPENALKLMRSRYSAYALKKADYIIKTTHPENPSFSSDKVAWKNAILHFCRETDFIGLTILEFIDGEGEAYVTFFAHLKQKRKDVSFEEKSRFMKVEGL